MKLPRHNLSNDVRTSSTSMNGRENSEPIPYDLIYELLLRLPAKSIARSRCVSKLWASILRRHDFTELFLTRSSTRQQLLFVFQRDSKLSFFTAPQNPDNISSLVVPDYHMKFTCVESSFEICGHVRGLVCVTHHQNVKGGKYTVLDICNPSTGQSLPLPKVKTKKCVSVLCFFAYDPIGKQFKVLSVTWPCNVNLPCKEYKILTLGRRKLSWRMIECSVPHHPTSRGICINGCLYYHSIVDRVEHRYLMVCFDVTSEKFTFIRKPTGDVKWNQSILVNYNGKLATLTSDRCGKLIGQSRYIELWVIADAEKHEWSKHIYELPSLWKDVVHSYSYFTGISGATEIMLSPRDSSDPFDVFYYNFERKTIRKVKILGMDALKHSRMDTLLHHVEDVKLM